MLKEKRARCYCVRRHHLRVHCSRESESDWTECESRVSIASCAAAAANNEICMAREHPFGAVEIPAIRPDSPELIVAGLSSRALARSARLAGYAPLAIDVFGDDDTRDMSEKTI